ncbi:MAG TPA: ABC-2 family transporter protein [Kofleriaceae bacterium]|jgi:ABC-2 type transport system permease protein
MRNAASRAIRALPTLLRIGVADTVAYRAEFLVWTLTATMPLIMMGLWTSVAGEGDFRGYSPHDFVAYFLVVLIVRNLTGNWAAWQMGEEIRQGTMSMRLLRPIHPFVAIGANHAAALPFRSAVVLPVAVILLASSGAHSLTTSPVALALFPLSIVLAWLLTFSVQFILGTLAFWLTQAMAIATLYLGLYHLFSGYLLPLDLMPGWIRTVADVLPFRYMLSVPVYLLVPPAGHPPYTTSEMLALVGGQAAWVAALIVVALLLWRRGVRRFEAVGA